MNCSRSSAKANTHIGSFSERVAEGTLVLSVAISVAISVAETRKLRVNGVPSGRTSTALNLQGSMSERSRLRSVSRREKVRSAGTLFSGESFNNAAPLVFGCIVEQRLGVGGWGRSPPHKRTLPQPALNYEKGCYQKPFSPPFSFHKCL